MKNTEYIFEDGQIIYAVSATSAYILYNAIIIQKYFYPKLSVNFKDEHGNEFYFKLNSY